MESCFSWAGPEEPKTPLLLSVPHAGRHYPDGMSSLCRLPVERLRSLEDRHADALCTAALKAGHSAIIANHARAWIDLNRAENELDASMIAGGLPTAMIPRTSAKVRGGLGLVPRRISQGGELWKKTLEWDDVERRISHSHRPYHEAVGVALKRRLDRFGCAVLLDLHSMPPPPAQPGASPPHIVVGDLYGQTAGWPLTACVVAEAEQAGFRVSINQPYAGGYILERHARPARGIHALQLEIDRSLYLDSAFDALGNGAPVIAQLVRRLSNMLVQTLLNDTLPIAAE